LAVLPILSVPVFYGMLLCGWNAVGENLTFRQPWWTAFLILAGVTLLLCAANWVIVLCRLKKGIPDPQELRRWNSLALGYKLVSVPFFVLNFFFWLTVGIVAFLPGGFLFLPVLLPAAAVTYAAMLTSSADTVGVLLAYRKRGRNVPVRHLIFQFLFVLDVPDECCLHRKFRKEK